MSIYHMELNDSHISFELQDNAYTQKKVRLVDQNLDHIPDFLEVPEVGVYEINKLPEKQADYYLSAFQRRFSSVEDVLFKIKLDPLKQGTNGHDISYQVNVSTNEWPLYATVHYYCSQNTLELVAEDDTGNGYEMKISGQQLAELGFNNYFDAVCE